MKGTTRITNLRGYHIGIPTQSGREYNIPPHGYITLPYEDIEWAASIAPSLFVGEKQLQVADRFFAIDMGFIEDENAKSVDDELIRKQLGQAIAKVEAWLVTISEPYLLDAIYRVSTTMNLSSSKLKVLQEKMPDRDFLGDGS